MLRRLFEKLQPEREITADNSIMKPLGLLFAGIVEHVVMVMIIYAICTTLVGCLYGVVFMVCSAVFVAIFGWEAYAWTIVLLLACHLIWKACCKCASHVQTQPDIKQEPVILMPGQVRLRIRI